MNTPAVERILSLHIKPGSTPINNRIFVAAIFALIVGVTPARATEAFARVGTISVGLLGLEQGLRNVGMGGTGVAGVNQPRTGYYNPAVLAWSNHAALSFGYQRLFENVSMTDTRASMGHRFGDEASPSAWRIGGELGYTTLDLDAQVTRTIFLPDGTGEVRDLTDYYLTSAVGVAWERGGESIGLGVSAKHMNLDPDRNVSWLFDFGLAAAMEFQANGSTIRPRFGVVSLNNDTGLSIGDSTEFDIAGTWRYGVGLDFATSSTVHGGREVALASASLDVDFVDLEDRNTYWAFGWEVAVLEFIQMRAGYQLYEEGGSATTLGLGMGWQFGKVIVQADYARKNRPSIFSFDTNYDMFGATLGYDF